MVSLIYPWRYVHSVHRGSLMLSYGRNYLFAENAITKCQGSPIGFAGFEWIMGYRFWRFPEPLQSSGQLLTALFIHKFCRQLIYGLHTGKEKHLHLLARTHMQRMFAIWRQHKKWRGLDAFLQNTRPQFSFMGSFVCSHPLAKHFSVQVK